MGTSCDNFHKKEQENVTHESDLYSDSISQIMLWQIETIELDNPSLCT